MRLEVKNFQSIQEALIDLEGFTVITGASNRGKSALVRAAEALLFNEGGNDVIQHGSVSASVKLIEAPHNVLYWQRNENGGVHLILNGHRHSRVARDYLTLIAPFGFREVETKYKTFRPQVANQHDPPFLLTVSPNVVAEALQVVGNVDLVTEAQRYCSGDKKIHETAYGVREHDLKNIQINIDAFGNFQEVLDNLTTVSLVFYDTKDLVDKYYGTEKAVSFVKKICELPAIPPVSKVSIHIQNLVHISTKLTEYISIKELGVKVPAAPAIVEPVSDLELIRKIELFLKIKKATVQRQAEVLQINIEGQKIVEEKMELEVELNVCPECNRPYEGE